jgi:hypothetical protein
MTAADVAVAKADRAAKQLEIETANVQVCDEIALKIQELNAELKRRRDVVTVSDGSADESDDSSDGDWADAKLLEVRQQISMWHEKQQRSNHTAAAPGDSDIDRFKYDLLMKHLKSQYKQPDGSQKKGQIPSVPEQADALLSSVVVNCPTCKGLCADRVERKRAWTAAEALTAKTDAEWSQRYRHRLQENEYESDGNHQGDDKCGVCRQFSGRRGKMGINSPSRDPKDKDELRNCEGADCTRAFHCDCRCLEQDTPETRRRYGMDPLVPITCGRRIEPWLCNLCWKSIEKKQFAYDKKLLAAEKEKFEKQAKKPRHDSASSSAVKPSSL